MFVTNALSEQQVFTMYAIGTFLTVFLLALIVAGFLGLLHHKTRSLN